MKRPLLILLGFIFTTPSPVQAFWWKLTREEASICRERASKEINEYSAKLTYKHCERTIKKELQEESRREKDLAKKINSLRSTLLRKCNAIKPKTWRIWKQVFEAPNKYAGSNQLYNELKKFNSLYGEHPYAWLELSQYIEFEKKRNALSKLKAKYKIKYNSNSHIPFWEDLTEKKGEILIRINPKKDWILGSWYQHLSTHIQDPTFVGKEKSLQWFEKTPIKWSRARCSTYVFRDFLLDDWSSFLAQELSVEWGVPYGDKILERTLEKMYGDK